MARTQLNVVALLAGIAGIVSYLFLPWITISTPIVAVLQFGVSASTLVNIAGFLPGNLLSSLWLVPGSGVLLAAVSFLGMGSKKDTPRMDAFWQLLAGVGFLVPALAMLYTYNSTLDLLKKSIPSPILLPVETVLYLGAGFYIVLCAALVCLLVGIINWRSVSSITETKTSIADP